MHGYHSSHRNLLLVTDFAILHHHLIELSYYKELNCIISILSNQMHGYHSSHRNVLLVTDFAILRHHLSELNYYKELRCIASILSNQIKCTVSIPATVRAALHLVPAISLTWSPLQSSVPRIGTQGAVLSTGGPRAGMERPAMGTACLQTTWSFRSTEPIRRPVTGNFC